MFAPVVPLGGYAGWKFLTRTIDAQSQAFRDSPAFARDVQYFREKIGGVKTAEALVSDRRLLSVALGAYGLDADINARAFIRKVLEDGTLTPGALANKLADKRYLELSKAFGFGDFAVPRTQLSDFADKIVARYGAQRFEAAVGETNGTMRLALNAQRELPAIAARSSSETTKWLTVMGTAPLRTVVETAFGLPRGFPALDLDQQLTVLRERSERFLGSGDLSVLKDPAKLESLIRLYTLRSEAAAGTTASPALSLLAGGRR